MIDHANMILAQMLFRVTRITVTQADYKFLWKSSSFLCLLNKILIARIFRCQEVLQF